jgi:hypothetical protein
MWCGVLMMPMATAVAVPIGTMVQWTSRLSGTIGDFTLLMAGMVTLGPFSE